MAFHVFLKGGCDAAVVECGIGGEYDSTNVLVRPTVAGVTSLGVDHVAMLGNTVEEIAWHKAGIFKEGVEAFTVEQPEGALRVLRERAAEKGEELRVVGRDPRVERVKLGLAADFQKVNASLAVAVAAEHLRVMRVADIRAEEKLPEEFVRGLEEVRWGGRCETRIQGAVGWYLDGGHTLESIVVAGEWFAGCVLESVQDERAQPEAASAFASTNTSSHPPRILIFNQQTRAGLPLLRSLHGLLCQKLDEPHPLTHVIFCSNVTFSSGYRPDLVSMNVEAKEVEDLSVQNEAARGWRELDGEGSQILVVRTIEDAVEKAKEIAGSWVGGVDGGADRGKEGGVKVLVTGSLHLVGGALEVLETAGKGASEGKVR